MLKELGISVVPLVALLSTGSVHAKEPLYDLPLDHLTVNGRYRIPDRDGEKEIIAFSVGRVMAKQTHLELLMTIREDFTEVVSAALQRSLQNYGYETNDESEAQNAAFGYEITDIKISRTDKENRNFIRVSLDYTLNIETDNQSCQTLSNTVVYDLHNSRPLRGLDAVGAGLARLFVGDGFRVSRRERATLEERNDSQERAWRGYGEGEGDFRKEKFAVRYAVLKSIQLSFVNLIYKLNVEGICTPTE